MNRSYSVTMTFHADNGLSHDIDVTDDISILVYALQDYAVNQNDKTAGQAFHLAGDINYFYNCIREDAEWDQVWPD